MRPTLRIALIGIGALALAAGATGLIVAANPTDQLPPEKAAMETRAAQNRANAPRADKTKAAAARALVVQVDPPPDTGLLGPVGAPVPGGIFTPTNAWAGWTDATTYTVVYAGDSPDHPGQGELFVVRRSGANSHLDPTIAPATDFISPPVAGGPLRIDRLDGANLVIANPGGREFVFRPAARTFAP